MSHLSRPETVGRRQPIVQLHKLLARSRGRHLRRAHSGVETSRRGQSEDVRYNLSGIMCQSQRKKSLTKRNDSEGKRSGVQHEEKPDVNKTKTPYRNRHPGRTHCTGPKSQTTGPHNKVLCPRSVH